MAAAPGLADDDGLAGRLESVARPASALTTLVGGTYKTWTWGEWRSESERFAAGLQAHGFQRGDTVACLLDNSFESCVAVLGVGFAGGCVASLPLMPRGASPDAYAGLLRRVIDQAQPFAVACADATTPLLVAAGIGPQVIGYRELMAASRGHRADPDFPGPDAPAFVQYSSGSTGAPHGCVLTTRTVAAQLERLGERLAFEPDRDIVLSWLPISHDMGLFGGLLLSYWMGYPFVLGDPVRFMRQPWTWMDDCERFGATSTAGPNFALDIATRAAAARPPKLLSRLRSLVLGGERISPATLQRSEALLRQLGIDKTVLTPAYGLAEGVLAVSVTHRGKAPRVLRFDAQALASGVAEPSSADQDGSNARLLVSSGPPIRDVTINTGPPGRIGEIVVNTSSLASGYLRDPEATARRFTEAGLRTGDLGFVLDGELFVTGRKDDLMQVAGRNVYAHDIEDAVSRASGIRPGTCAVVQTDGAGGPRMVALAELRDGHPDVTAIAVEMRTHARQVGVRLSDCIFVPKGEIPKTPSGKLQRSICRDLAADPSSRYLVVR